MKMVTRPLILLLATCLAASPLVAWNPEAEENAREAIAKFKEKDPDMQAFFDQAVGYAVFPKVGKGGLGIGGARGTGLLFESHQPSGRVSLTQVTIGLQFGGQAYSEIIFFEDGETLRDFKSGDFEFSAQASAVAVTLGASADANYEHGVAVFTMTRGGLMYEASVGGQKFNYHP